MAETLNLQIKGLYTNPNQLSSVPQGALNVADNIVIDRDSVADTRRGQNYYGSVFVNSLHNLLYFEGSVLVHSGSSLYYDLDGSGTWVKYSGSFDAPASWIRLHSIKSNLNLYLTSGSGVLKLDTLTGSFVDAGAPKALFGTATLTNPGFMTDSVNVAYRMVWGYKDANNNEIIGAPSQRLIVANDSGDTADVVLTWAIPDGITTTWFYRVFRSGESANLTSEPDDELQLVKEGQPTSGEISAKEFTFTDIVPNSLRGATLYTSPSQEGIAQANDQPPLCKDATLYRGFAIYINTISKQRFIVTLISVGDNTLDGSFGYQTNNGTTSNTMPEITGLAKAASIVIQDLTYTADDTGIAGNNITVRYIAGGTAGSEIVTVSGTDITVTIEDAVSTATQISDAVNNSPNAASVVIQDLTYTADNAGVAGNLINLTYVGGGTAGSEVVTVTENDIEVEIEDGVSTATQIKTAVDLVSEATDLIDCTVSGTGSNPQSTQAQTFLTGGNDDAATLVDVTVTGTGSNAQDVVAQTSLEDGFDTSTLNVGMRIIGSGIPTGAVILTIDSISQVTMDMNATASATVPLEFQDVFRINDLEYFAASATDQSSNSFQAFLDGTPSENIQNTTLEMIKVINQDTGNSIVYAYYLSGFEDLPGQMLIEERSIGGAEFYLTSTNGESFSPILYNTGQDNVSTNEEKQHYIRFSKFQQPESVPLPNFFAVGSENFPARRVLGLRDSCFILKDDGIFRLTGEDKTSFTVSLFDSSAKIIAYDSAVILNNQIFCLSDQGIISISDNGVQIISRPIETTLLELTSDLFPYFQTSTFAVGYETDRKYMLFTVTAEEDTYATQAFIYNTITNTFTRWVMDRSCGIVLDSDNKLYMGNPANLYVYKERKDFNRTDYADEQFDITISSIDNLVLTLADASNVEVGYTIKQSGLEALVEEISGNDVTVNVSQPWSVGAAIAYKPISDSIEWVPNTSSNPGVLKQFSECTLFFKNPSFSSLDVSFQSAFADSFETVTIDEIPGLGWGQFSWGEAPWGIGGNRAFPIRTLVPLEKQRSSWINFKVSHAEAFTNLSLTGISAQFNEMSSRFR